MTISTQMWLRMKPLIERLYRDEELHLKLVLPRVRREGFNPTEAQLRNKLKKWGIRKPNRKPRASSKKSSQTEVVKVSESHQHRALRPKPPGVLGEPCAQWIHTPAAGPAPRIDSYSTEPAYQTVKTSYPTPASHVFSGAPSQGDVSRFNDVSVTHPVLQTYTDLPVLSLDDLAVTSSSPGTLSPKTAPCLSGVNTPYPTLQNLEGAQSTSLGGVINTNDNRICSRQLMTPSAPSFSSPCQSTSLCPQGSVVSTPFFIENAINPGNYWGLLRREKSSQIFLADSSILGNEAMTSQTPLQSLSCDTTVDLTTYGCSSGIPDGQLMSSMGQPGTQVNYPQQHWPQSQTWVDTHFPVPHDFNGPAWYDCAGNYRTS